MLYLFKNENDSEPTQRYNLLNYEASLGSKPSTSVHLTEINSGSSSRFWNRNSFTLQAESEASAQALFQHLKQSLTSGSQ